MFPQNKWILWFSEKLKDFCYTLGSTLVSFDVTNLFTNVLVKDSIDYMYCSLLMRKSLTMLQWKNWMFLWHYLSIMIDVLSKVLSTNLGIDFRWGTLFRFWWLWLKNKSLQTTLSHASINEILELLPIYGPWDLEKFRALPRVVADLWLHRRGGLPKKVRNSQV